MIRMSHTSFLLAFAGLGILALGAAPAYAQVTTPSRQVTTASKPDPKATPVEQAPPPALPGATATVAPAEKTLTDLAPTDALFDAINRGDIVSARDAVSRGADLNGRNVLGMTPVDLSVDLSRNDITFLLLSLRGATPGAASPVHQRTAVTLPVKTAQKPDATHKPAAIAAAKPARLISAASVAPAPRQFAGQSNPGTPDPQVGFLGFGGPAVQ
jgi:hypothetical protein